MNTLLEEIEIEDHPLPPDTWGEAPQTLQPLMDSPSASSALPTTPGPHIEAE